MPGCCGKTLQVLVSGFGWNGCHQTPQSLLDALTAKSGRCYGAQEDLEVGGSSVETPQLAAQPGQPAAVLHICLCQLI